MCSMMSMLCGLEFAVLHLDFVCLSVSDAEKDHAVFLPDAARDLPFSLRHFFRCLDRILQRID